MAQKQQRKKKTETGDSQAYRKLREDLKAGSLGRAYLFYGEESYLRQRSLEDLRKALVPGGFEAFNYHRLDGRSVTMQDLADALAGLPMMAERTLVTVTDLDLFRMNTEERDSLVAILSDLPEYSCLVFVYDTLAYEPNRTMKKLVAALEAHVETVEFRPANNDQLIRWVGKHFADLGKDIDRPTAEHLLFTCGNLMAGLDQEIRKIGTYARGQSVTRADIDAVAIPVLSAEAFRLSDAVAQGRTDQAAAVLGDLLELQEEPIMILGALGLQMRRLYTARLAIDGGKDRRWLSDLWGISDYPARLLMDAARRTTTAWCAGAVKQCQLLDRRMKSGRGVDSVGELKLLVARLGVRQP